MTPIHWIHDLHAVDFWYRGVILFGEMLAQVTPKRCSGWKDLFNKLPLDRFNYTKIELKTGQAEGNQFRHLFQKSDEKFFQLCRTIRISKAVVLLSV